MFPTVSVAGRLARIALAVACVAATAGSMVTGLRAQTVTMRFAHSLPEATYVVQSTKYWIDLVDKRSGGRLKIKLYPGGSLIRLTEAFDALSLNTVQFSDMANSYATPKVKDLAPLDLPGAFPSKRILETHDAIFGVMNEILNKQDVAYLFAYDLGPNTIDLRSGSAIKSPQDLQGKVIRDAGSWSGKVLRACSGTRPWRGPSRPR